MYTELLLCETARTTLRSALSNYLCVFGPAVGADSVTADLTVDHDCEVSAIATLSAGDHQVRSETI